MSVESNGNEHAQGCPPGVSPRSERPKNQNSGPSESRPASQADHPLAAGHSRNRQFPPGPVPRKISTLKKSFPHPPPPCDNHCSFRSFGGPGLTEVRAGGRRRVFHARAFRPRAAKIPAIGKVPASTGRRRVDVDPRTAPVRKPVNRRPKQRPSAASGMRVSGPAAYRPDKTHRHDGRRPEAPLPEPGASACGSGGRQQGGFGE